MSRTFWPSSAIALPIDATVVVLATPPFWLAMAIVRVTRSIVPVVSVPRIVGLPPGVLPEQVALPDATLAVIRTTTDSADQRAILVPGFTGSKEDFAQVLPHLANLGADSVAIDQLGQYESRTDAGEDRFETGALAADLVALARAVWPEGRRPHLVGHSMGGLVARRAVIEHPGEFASLTLMSSGPAAVPEHQRGQLETLRTLLPDTSAELIWTAKKALDAARGAPEPTAEVEDFLQRRWLANSPHSMRAKAGILLGEPDLTDELRATGAPTCVVLGVDDDVWWPDHQLTMAQRLGAPVLLIADAGHSPPVEAPRAVARGLMWFWRTRAADRGLSSVGGVGIADLGHPSNMMMLHLAEPVAVSGAREARRVVRDHLDRWGLPDDDAELVAGELVQNAIVHAGAEPLLGLRAGEGVVRVEVTDTSTTAPRLAPAPPEELRESGRGIVIVDALSSDWGTEISPGGKTVWAEIRVAG